MIVFLFIKSGKEAGYTIRTASDSLRTRCDKR